jgi:hypothetical protein
MKGFRQPPGRQPKHVVAALKKERAAQKRARRQKRRANKIVITVHRPQGAF